MAITIQLNGDALNKLIDLNGGDEFVLQLRQGVMENVLSQRVKALTNEAAYVAQASIIKKMVEEEVGTFKKDTWGAVTAQIQPELLAVLETKARDAASKALDELTVRIEEVAREKANEFIARRGVDIEEYINSKVDKLNAEYIDSMVKAKLRASLQL